MFARWKRYGADWRMENRRGVASNIEPLVEIGRA
jgi:hypothetical protein